MTSDNPSPGDLIGSLKITVMAEPMKVWAVALHDPNPIHLDIEAVRKMGLGDRLINQGPINMAYVFELLRRRFSGATIKRSRFQFLDNAFEGEELEASGTVLDVNSSPSETEIRCQIALSAADGRSILAGEVLLTLLQE
jgi:3-hydroxybutyryl-CoA dehydratase